MIQSEKGKVSEFILILIVCLFCLINICYLADHGYITAFRNNIFAFILILIYFFSVAVLLMFFYRANLRTLFTETPVTDYSIHLFWSHCNGQNLDCLHWPCWNVRLPPGKLSGRH